MKRAAHPSSEPVNAAAHAQNEASNGAVTRRGFVAGTAAATAMLAAPAIAQQGAARVVIVGGGPGGATAARYLKRNAPNVDVTLINFTDRYTTCFFSNMYLAGFWSLKSLTYGYNNLVQNYGVRFLRDIVTDVDRERRVLTLRYSDPIAYDRLVLAPGISFRPGSIEGYDQAAQQVMPHAYHAGFQTWLLHRRIRSMRRGGTFALSVPKGPYRAGTGPYERASMIAHVLKRENPRAKIKIIDSKDKFGLQDQFLAQWQKHYGDMIEWVPAAATSGGVSAVDANAMTITTQDGSRLKVDAACIIPPQRAGGIVLIAGLADESGWAPVDPADMRSRLDPNVYVLGDAAIASPMPKSAYSANSQAHRCAAALQSELSGQSLATAKYRAVAWAYINPIAAIKSGASFEGSNGKFEKVTSFKSSLDDSDDSLRAGALEGISWYAGVTADIFS